MPSVNLLGSLNQGQSFYDNQQQQEFIKKQRLIQLDEQRKGALFKDARMVNSYLKAGQPEQAANLLTQRAEFIQQLGGDPSDTLEPLSMIQAGDIKGAMSLLDSVEMAGVQSGYLKDLSVNKNEPTETRAFNDLLSGLSDTEKKLAKRIKLGLAPRAVGSSAQTISQDKDMIEDVANVENVISSAKETGKLASQYKLKPKIAEAVGIATAKAKAKADDDTLAKSNNKALGVYDVAIKALADSLGKTATGPIIDVLPALTADAQSAEGAIAMMGPTLKGVFREAGEGTFTEGDQKLLMDMLPTRKDRPEAREFKMKTIDTMIRLKLGQQATQPKPPANQKPLSEMTLEELKALRAGGAQ